MHFTRDQVKTIIEKMVNEDGGLQSLMRMGLEALMKAERTEHNISNKDQGNGYRPRLTLGQGKIMELKVPRTRKGNFYPVILTLLRDQEEEARRLAFSLYGAGLTTQQVGDLFGELYGRSYSTSQVSRMFTFAREEVAQWLCRPLDPYYPIVMVDATFIYTRRGDNVSKEAYYSLLGVRTDRTREVLAVVNFPTESAVAWEEVFRNLRERGLREICLMVSDGLSGMEEAFWRVFPCAQVQLCTVHLERNVLKYVKPKDKQQVADEFRNVFRTGDRQDTKVKAMERWSTFCEKWGKDHRAIGNMGKSLRHELYFTYMQFDYRIHSMIHSTNWIERLNRDYKRTTRMRGALPNAQATILLLGHVAMTRSAYLRKVPKLNYESKKFRWEEQHE